MDKSMDKKATTTKKVITVCLIIILCAVVTCFCAMSYSGYRGVVKEALRIKYGWQSEEHLKDIATTEFMDSLGDDSIVQGWKLYTIARISVDTTSSHLENDEIMVTVELYNPDILFAIFTLVKTDEGKYLIQDLGYDI